MNEYKSKAKFEKVKYIKTGTSNFLNNYMKSRVFAQLMFQVVQPRKYYSNL